MQEEVKELFDKWKKSNVWRVYSEGQEGTFVEDGIVNEDVWRKQKVKILFVLKETDGLCEDLRKFLSKTQGGKRSMWQNVLRWADYLLHGKENSTAKIHTPQGKEIIEKIAVMNIKKTPGQAKENIKTTRTFVEKNLQYIKEEIQLINPQIIVWGASSEFIKENKILESEPIDTGNRKVHLYKAKDRLILDSYHPGSFGKYRTTIGDFKCMIERNEALFKDVLPWI